MKTMKTYAKDAKGAQGRSNKNADVCECIVVVYSAIVF